MSFFDLSHLKYFYFTVTEGGVSAAAKKLHVQQPVVSKMLAQLEEEMGQQLFWKSGRKKVLSDFGQLVFRHCQSIFEDLERIQHIVQGKANISGVFSIGASDAITACFMPEVISELSKRFPKLQINLYSGVASTLLKKLEDYQLDCCLFFHLPKLNEDIEVLERHPERFRVVVKKSHRDNFEVIESFIGSREIDNLNNTRFPTIDFMKKFYPNTKIALSSNNLEFHRQMVLRGKGTSILPEVLIQKDLQKELLIDLFPSENFFFDLKLVKRKSKNLSEIDVCLANSLGKVTQMIQKP